MVKVYYNIPGVGVVKKERTFRTKFIQDKETGQMRGRKRVEGKGDGTGILRFKKKARVVTESRNKDGTIKKEYHDYEPGEIGGRFS